MRFDFSLLESLPFLASIFIQATSFWENRYINTLIHRSLSQRYPNYNCSNADCPNPQMNDDGRQEMSDLASDAHKRTTFLTSIFIAMISAVAIASKNQDWPALSIFVILFAIIYYGTVLVLPTYLMGDLMQFIENRGGTEIRIFGSRIRKATILALISFAINICFLLWINLKLDNA